MIEMIYGSAFALIHPVDRAAEQGNSIVERATRIGMRLPDPRPAAEKE